MSSKGKKKGSLSSAASTSASPPTATTTKLTSTTTTTTTKTSPTAASSSSPPPPSVPTPVPRLDAGVRLAYLVILGCSVLGLLHVLPVYPHMMLVTLATIYIGSQSSVVCHSSESTVTETMQTKDAMLFPVIGSVVLFSLYLVFKVFPKEYINVVIKAYFFLFGAIVLTGKVDALLERTLPVPVVQLLTSTSVRVRHPLTFWPLTYLAEKPPAPKAVEAAEDGERKGKEEEETVVDATEGHETVAITPLFGVSVAASLLLAVYWLWSNHWLSSNLFGVAFSIQGIELLSLGSYLNGLILLCGLFVYDVFWVFGTEVMVTVAKSFDAPIKLLFPQTDADERPSMLGLGDIVIPGIFIALLLRYDHFHHQRRHLERQQQQQAAGAAVSARPHLHLHGARDEAVAVSAPSATPYFTTNMVAYFIGLSTTVGVMYAFKAAQPALLYLVPACIGGSMLTALSKGEVGQMLKYVEGEKTGAAAEDAKKEQ